MHVSLFSFNWYIHLAVGAWYLVDNTWLLFGGEGTLYPGEKAAEGGTGPKHHPVAEVSTHSLDPLANACDVRKKGYWRLIVLITRLSLSSSLNI